MDRLSVVTPRRGLAIVLVIGAAFFASWFNGYLPPTSGGETVLMTSWGANYLPYRDYYSQAPPGVPMLVRAVVAVGGPHLLATLTFGVLLRMAGACALYALLLRVSRPSYAALGTLTSLFVSSTDISDTPFYYNHIGAALILIGTYLGYVGATGERIQHRVATVTAAAFLTFAVAVKQTMIFGSFAAFVALVILVWPRPKAGWIAWLAALIAGGLLMVGAMWAWLWTNNIAESFWFVMRRAPEGKGGVLRSLFRPLLLLPSIPEAFLTSIAAWIVIAGISIFWVRHRQRKTVPHEVRLVFGVLLAIIGGALINFQDPRVVTLFLTALGWWGALAFSALYIGSLFKADALAQRAVIGLGVLSFGIGYCFSVSWPLFENNALPGLAVVIAVILENPPTLRPRLWVRAIAVLACVSMGVSVYRKFTFPHAWGDWKEPPLLSTRGEFHDTKLVGIRMAKKSADLFRAVAAISKQTTQADDPIYVYPNMPVLYAIADRKPATYAVTHWVDTCPDFLGKEDSARLRADPPKLLILRDYPIAAIANEERVYRGGEPSSVREVIGALADIKPLYTEVAMFNLAGYPPVIRIYVRNDVQQHVASAYDIGKSKPVP